MGDWLDEGGSGVPVDVLSLMDSNAGPLIYEVVATGALVSMGVTADGGALGVTVTVDGRWRREFFRDSEELADWLRLGLPDIEAAVASARQARASSSGPRRRRGL